MVVTVTHTVSPSIEYNTEQYLYTHAGHHACQHLWSVHHCVCWTFFCEDTEMGCAQNASCMVIFVCTTRTHWYRMGLTMDVGLTFQQVCVSLETMP